MKSSFHRQITTPSRRTPKCYEEEICKSTHVVVRIITVNNELTAYFADVTLFDLHSSREFDDQIRLLFYGAAYRPAAEEIS